MHEIVLWFVDIGHVDFCNACYDLRVGNFNVLALFALILLPEINNASNNYLIKLRMVKDNCQNQIYQILWLTCIQDVIVNTYNSLQEKNQKVKKKTKGA